MKDWERQKGESAKAYEAAKIYFEMGVNRSIEAVGKQLDKSWRFIGRWSARYNWVIRADSYDREQDRIQSEERTKAAAKEADKWAKRRSEQREREWAQAEMLIERAMQMLKYPLSRQEVKAKDKDGNPTITIVEPAKWTFKDAAVYLDSAAKLARLAAQMETENVKVESDSLNKFLASLEKVYESFPVSDQQDYERPVIH
jgi:hypothetical protein